MPGPFAPAALARSNGPVKRRILQFSVRSLLVAMTLLAGWLAVVTSRARNQQETVKSLNELGWHVRYDWQDSLLSKPRGPAWIRRIVGDDYFQSVVVAVFALSHDGIKMDSARTEQSIVLLQRLPDLDRVFFASFNTNLSDRSIDAFRSSLPGCHVGLTPF